MEKKLTGKKALVTGAARGLGRETALRLASLGADVGVIDINFESFKEFKGEAELLTDENVMKEIENLGQKTVSAVADIGNREQVFQAVEKIAQGLGAIDICVAIAGGGMGAPDGNKPSTMNWEQYHAVINRNLHGTVYTCYAVAPYMKQAHSGKIVTMGSVGGIIANSDGAYSHYGIAKAGIIHYTRYLAQELGPYNINVNCIAPGYMATGRLKDLYTQAGEETFLSRTALKRFGTSADVADGIEFLVSNQSDYMTGHILKVEGGILNRVRVD